ncbi:MAG TPA: aldose epimerase family protein [Rectinemataceae bacterium]|nr:aldose epimerase family protein [Rectinemataceae bacterium]
MSIQRLSYGILSTGEEASLFALRAGDFVATFSDYGATFLSMLLPDGRGGVVDILLGSSTLAGLAAPHPYFGATVGRFANRIAKAGFTLSGARYELAANDGANHLHGGLKGFDKYIWKAEAAEIGGSPALRLKRTSPSGEEGYPGRLEVEALYKLDADGRLESRFEARSDAETIVNLTNHAYFNLRGEGNGDILDHELRLAASRYVPVGKDMLPLGGIAPLAGTAFDFRKPKRIGADIAAAGGFDHCYVIDREGEGLVDFAELREPASGRRMTMATTMPGVQFYTGNFLSGIPGKRGSTYGKHAGLCLETELFPDAPNQSDFPTAVLAAGQPWAHSTVYRFFP